MIQQNASYSEWILKYRYLVLGLVTAFTLLGAAGAQFLYFDNDYRVFFGKENPQLKAFEQVQQTYTKIDNVNFAVDPKRLRAGAQNDGGLSDQADKGD